MFDNKQNHHAKPPDALSVSGMNLSNGGANQRRMRNGWYLDSSGNRIEQEMVLEDGLPQRASNMFFKREVYGIRHWMLRGQKASYLNSLILPSKGNGLKKPFLKAGCWSIIIQNITAS